MVVSTNVRARKYLTVTSGQEISVDMYAYEASDVSVFYGRDANLAVSGTDYTVALSDTFDSFTLTVDAALVAKIAALISADATEADEIVVRCSLDMFTEATAAGVRHTPFTSREFDRAALRDQQLEDEAIRALRLGANFAPPYPDLSIKQIPSDLSEQNTLVFLSGGGLGVGPSTAQVTTAAASASASAAAAETAAASAISAADGAVTTANAAAASVAALSGVPAAIAALQGLWANVSSYWRTVLQAADEATAHIALGLGTAATADTGTDGGNVPVLDAGGKLLEAVLPNTLGVGQTWQNVTASRSSDVAYQNTTGGPIQIAITVTDAGGCSLELSTDGSTWDRIMASGPVGTVKTPFSLNLPANQYYRLVGAASIDEWWELR